MSLKVVPLRVRVHLYLFYAGMVLAGLGVLGFILSFGQVGSSAQAMIDVHEDIPVVAYAAIFAWAIGLVLMWYGRKTVDAAVREKTRENQEALRAQQRDAKITGLVGDSDPEAPVSVAERSADQAPAEGE